MKKVNGSIHLLFINTEQCESERIPNLAKTRALCAPNFTNFRYININKTNKISKMLSDIRGKENVNWLQHIFRERDHQHQGR